MKYCINYSWQRIPNPVYIAYLPPLFFKFCLIPCPIASNLHPIALFVALFLWLNEWLCHFSCFLLNDIVYLHMLSLGTLVPEGLCKFYKRCQVYWGLTYNVVFCWYSDLISHTQHSQDPIDWHAHINTY